MGHYVQLGMDIGYYETPRVQQDLRALALNVNSGTYTDSPVYMVLPTIFGGRCLC